MPGRPTARLVTSMAAALSMLAPAAVLAAGPAHSATSAMSDAAAASSNSAWLAHQLNDGTFPNPLQPELPDYGLMIDAVYAMYASGDGTLAAPVVDLIDQKKQAKRFFTYYGFGEGQDWLKNEGLDDRVGGATAKVLVAALVAGRDPRAFGGYDMVKETQNVIVKPDDVKPGGRFAEGSTTNPLFVIGTSEVGRVVDYGPTTSINNANTFGQALAVIGLAAVKQNDNAAINKLTWQQCSEGYFRILYSHDSANQLATCEQGKQTGESAPDRDSTGLGLSAMAAARRAGATGLDDPIKRATDWLEGEQHADGGWGGGVNTEPENTNSTGLVVQALADVGADPAVIAKGSAYLGSAQVTSADSATAMKNDIGAIAYTPAEYDAAKTDGRGALDPWVRAGAQASLGLSQVSFSQLVHVPGAAPVPTQPTPTEPPPTTPTPPPSTTAPASPTTQPTPNKQPRQSPSPRVAPNTSQGRTPPPRPRGSTEPAAPSTSSGQASTTPPPLRRPVQAGASAPRVNRPAAKTQAPGSAPTSGATSTASPWLQPTSATPSGRLARYLAGSLVRGERVEVVEAGQRFVDYDATADAVLALRSLGEQPATVVRASRFLLTPDAVKAYAHGAPYDRPSAAYAEPLAKLVLIGQMMQRGGDGSNQSAARVAALRASLLSLQGTDGTFQDSGTFGDRSATVQRHAMATLALTTAGDALAATRAVDALLSHQCTDGTFPADLTKTDCASGDLTATGWAAQALGVKPQSAPAARLSPAGAAAKVSALLPVLDPAGGAVTDRAAAASTKDRSGVLGASVAAVRAAVVGVMVPTANTAGVPATWSGQRLAAARRVTAALQAQTRADGLVVTAGKDDLAGSAVLAAGRQAVGLDASNIALTLGRRMLPDGGLPAAGGKKSDFTISLAAANGVAGGSWLTRSASPVTPVSFGLAAAPTAATAAVVSDANHPWWQRPWAFAIWLLLAATIGALAYAGARRLRPASIGAAASPRNAASDRAAVSPLTAVPQETAASVATAARSHPASETPTPTPTPNNGEPS